MDDAPALINDIEDYCRRQGMAESTFGRLAVNDGKFVSRVRAGGRVTTRTLARIQDFMAETHASSPATAPSAGVVRTLRTKGEDRPFRFYDNRQKYLLFVNTCSEKLVVAERVGMELQYLNPQPPALRVFDAGMRDGTVLTRVMRQMHRRFSNVPFFIVGKEISLEDVRLGLEKMPDRFFEHPATVLVVTNLYYTESPWLMPRSVEAAGMLNWQEVALTGATPYEFDEQIKALQPMLSEGWQVRSSAKTGNPLYVRPSVLVLYREDHRFLLDAIIPKPGHNQGNYDLVIASQPYRARMPLEFKASRVVSPLASSLAPGGRMLVIHSHGEDPGIEIIRRIWADEDPFIHNRHDILKEAKSVLKGIHRDLNFQTYADQRALFRYDMHTLPSEIGDSIGTSTLLAAWNAAIYVAQIDDQRVDEAMRGEAYLDATRDVLQSRGGLWFNDESFVISRRRL